MVLLGALSELPVDTDRATVWEHVRDKVHVDFFGARPGFGNGERPDEHRFRIDKHWPEPKQPWD